MTGLDELETRLGRLDLRLATTGLHLPAERIATIVAGEEPTDADAAHLAGCDECVELLIALGEGLEALAEDQPALGALMVDPPRPIRRRARFGALAIVLFAGAAAAAAGWLIRAAAPDHPPRPGARGAIEAPDPDAVETPILPAEQVVGRAAPAAPEPAAAVDLALVGDRLAAALGRGVDASTRGLDALDPISALDLLAGLPAALAAAATPAEAPPPRAPPRATRPPPARARPRLDLPGALERRDGPRPLERMPIDGPPRGFGHLQLNTRPPARVFIDGKPIGWTPIIDLRLAEGPHDVHLVFDSDLAAEPEQRFRVLIEPDRTWRMTRDNVRRAPRP
ncbi:MAG: hypothetical protein H6703_10995 [Myxococcales bacterium]|nr:hypothetical protein [Myxococcales bacterium]